MIYLWTALFSTREGSLHISVCLTEGSCKIQCYFLMKTLLFFDVTLLCLLGNIWSFSTDELKIISYRHREKTNKYSINIIDVYVKKCVDLDDI